MSVVPESSSLPPDEDAAVPKAAKAEEMTRLSPARRAKLLERVAAFYHQRFLDRPEAQQYLVKVRGIRNVSLFGDYRIGYADGSLLQALPQDAESVDPVPLLTTTSAALDEETASRFLTVSIDESAAMTERIFERQREADTLAGYLRQLEHRAVVRQHQAAQRLLEPLAVINPYAPQLHFPAHSLRARRDHKKYLMLIKAIAFLHQQQRPVKEHLHGDQVLRYIEATREDIRTANVIAESVLAQSASELSAPARTLLTYIHAHVQKHCAGQNVAPHEYTFTRKTVRDSIGWSDWQVRTHIRELEELEYLKARSGAWGKEYLYELLGDGTDAGASGLTLTDPDELREPAT